MQSVVNDSFMLHSETARILFHESAEKKPIIDFHNHLNPQEIYEDKCFSNISDLWLGGDHYKWRLMRAMGYPEELVSGNGDPYEKFMAWADTVENSIGNPIYHWTHLELARYFGITEAFTPESAPRIWEECNAKLSQKEYSVRNLLRMQGVEALCTTDDPADDLHWHKMIKEDGFEIKVLPTFRPEKAMAIDKADFTDYLQRLSDASGVKTDSAAAVAEALTKRLDFFVENGCVISDHSLEGCFYVKADTAEVESIFAKRIAGQALSDQEIGKYKGYILVEMGKAYAKRDLAMQLHIGAIRNNSRRNFERLGVDHGLDGTHDFNYADQISALLSEMDYTDQLPKTVLYYLNPKDADMLVNMAYCFQENSKKIRGKVQVGSAWWFCDHRDGMEKQLKALADGGLISVFIGMLTDSRSFLSFPRHEYFRRILCNLVGQWVEDGEYPADMEFLKKLVANVSYNNSKEYLNI